MTEHFTQATQETTAWCHRCERLTAFTVSAGRIGFCKEHSAQAETKNQKHQREEKERRAKNAALWDEEAEGETVDQ